MFAIMTGVEEEMRKRAVVALLLAAILMLTGSCSLIVKDPEVDKQTIVLEVNGRAFTKGEFQEWVDSELDYQESLYSYEYGMALDRNDPEVLSYIQDAVLEMMTQQAVLEDKLAELGMAELSESELAEAESTAKETYDLYVDEIIAMSFVDSELTGDELRAAAEEQLTLYGYPTYEQLLESEKQTMIGQKLYQEAVKDVQVSEAELQEGYQTRVDSAIEMYGSNPEYYGSDLSDGITAYYAPAGYRYVKHVLVAFADVDQVMIDELTRQLDEKQEELSSVQDRLLALDESDATGETIDSQQTELLAQQETLAEEIVVLEEQLDAARETAYAAVLPTAEEVQAKAAQGEDFDQLIQQYGKDPGMEAEPAKTVGYLVSADSTNWVSEFTDAAMALQSIGEVSPVVRSSYGYHIIKYVSDVQEGAVPLESVREELEAELLMIKQDEAYQAQVEAWVAEADVKVYRNRIDN